MDLIIYVHDFHPQIGHSRAMIELLNGLSVEQKTQINSIEIVAFTCSELDEVFKSFNCSLKFTKIPLPSLKPFIIKMAHYHIISFLHSMLRSKRHIKIGIGIACLNVDIVNVQFIHEQWKAYFFKNRDFSFLARIYKKVLFTYFSICEKYVFSKRNQTQYILIANFLIKFLTHKFGTRSSQMTLIPSGVNTEEFKLIETENLFQQISLRYPQISELDPSKPIALFIGAFERKGLPKVFQALKELKDAQLIVIGKSENKDFIFPTLPYKVVHIPFTKEVSSFYQISDAFIFPTMYEPFGLVVIEAYVMGLDLFIPKEEVGASEIIPKSEGVYFLNQIEEVRISNLRKIQLDEKKKRRTDRINTLQEFTWEKSAQKFFKLLQLRQ